MIYIVCLNYAPPFYLLLLYVTVCRYKELLFWYWADWALLNLLSLHYQLLQHGWIPQYASWRIGYQDLTRHNVGLVSEETSQFLNHPETFHYASVDEIGYSIWEKCIGGYSTSISMYIICSRLAIGDPLFVNQGSMLGCQEKEHHMTSSSSSSSSSSNWKPKPPGAEWRRPNLWPLISSWWRERGHLRHPGEKITRTLDSTLDESAELDLEHIETQICEYRDMRRNLDGANSDSLKTTQFEDHSRLANAVLRDEAFATKAVASFARAVRHCAVALANQSALPHNARYLF